MYVIRSKSDVGGYIYREFSSDEKDLYGISDNLDCATKYSKEDALRLSESPLLSIRQATFYKVNVRYSLGEPLRK
jgi:hypothetical protein